MNRSFLIFDFPAWMVVLCILAGLSYALLLYYKPKQNWPIKLSYLLFALRFFLVTFLSMLLLSPIVKYLSHTIESPEIVIGLDNSFSIAQVTDSIQLKSHLDQLEAMGQQISDNGYVVRYLDLEANQLKTPTGLSYNNPRTNLYQFLKIIENRYEGRNLHAVILATDGIYNSGISPTFSSYGFDLHTLGMGDSVPKSDIMISELLYNRMAYEGNAFPIQAQVLNEGFVGQQTMVTLSRGNKVLESKRITFDHNRQLQNVDFLVNATEDGLQRYSIRIQSLDGEFTHTNNLDHAYIEIIEGKEKILLIARRPHPDIKALRSAVESNSNYEMVSFIPGISENIEQDKYDLVIMHQLPPDDPIAKKYLRDDVPAFYIYGNQISAGEFNRNEVAKIDALPGEFDQVTPLFNRSFSGFKFSQELQNLMRDLPPVIVPFGDVSIQIDAEPMLFQRVGSIETGRPLLVVKNSFPRQAAFLGEGIWRWKLHDYQKNNSHLLFNEFISKCIQFLSTREDKKKFRIYPLKNEMSGESVTLETEVYNDLFEEIFGSQIELKITNDTGETSSYSFITTENNTRFRLNGLKS
ncbi:MAG: VWA domain-containing protein, partial [Cyclobacteriaceae bacterium]|nr:VWA domain-containing protein [Cyclobacteriaceae bacterium]